jgi:5-formyltetrahydrofolate cyclo-ligase
LYEASGIDRRPFFYWNGTVKEKETVRDEIRRQIEGLSPEDRIVMDAQIATHITHLPFWETSSVVVGYMAIGDEVDLQAVLRASVQAGKRVALPRVEGSGTEMELPSVTDFPAGLERHAHGFLQPTADAPKITDLSSALLLIPGRAFDRSGHRLGRGGGYYDRFLADAEPGGVTVGVGYALQLRSHIPIDDLDRPVQIVITDSETCFCTRPKNT